MRFRFSMRSLLLTTALIALYFGCAGVYNRWYDSTYSGFVGFERLANLEPGTSFDRVAAHYLRSHQIMTTDLVDLGPSKTGKILHAGGFTYASSSLIKVLKDAFTQMEPGDELYYFEALNGGSYLQFRNEKLTNHSPNAYRPSIQLATLNNHPLPNVLLRFGILPFYLPFAVLVFYCCNRLNRRLNAPRNPNNVPYLAEPIQSSV